MWTSRRIKATCKHERNHWSHAQQSFEENRREACGSGLLSNANPNNNLLVELEPGHMLETRGVDIVCVDKFYPERGISDK